MTQKKINEILVLHKKWLNDEDGGKRADLSYAILSNAILSGANLRGADLSGADLSNADLSNADLSYAILSNAILSGADLSNADLSHANLRNANLIDVDLIDADLSHANLRNAILRNAILSNADLSNADLSGANLSGANLSGADLSNADLSNANLSGAKNIPFIRLSCPEYGSFIAWKKLSGGEIAKLLIPEEAKRSSATMNKCRASEAVVLSIENSDGTPCESGFSRHDKNFKYEVGKHLKVDDFDNNRWKECAPGIHFFINKQEAIEYN